MSDWKKLMDDSENEGRYRNQGGGKFTLKPKGREHKKDDVRKRRQAVRQQKESFA